MNKQIFIFIWPLLFSFCKNSNEPPITEREPNFSFPVKSTEWQPDPNGATIATRFPPPDGFERVSTPENSFAEYLQNLALKPEGTPVFLFNGEKKWNQEVHAAIIDINTGKRDLQQCADAVMRLRAEYLLAQNEFADIHFNFTNGFNADYLTWRNGKRIAVNGNEVSWRSTNRESVSYESFRKYLDMVFSYAGTLSLSKEMKDVPLKEMKIGDVFIKGGSPGHAVIVVDISVHPTTGKKVFLLAQSYMPAQDIHVLNNPAGGVWYSLGFGENLKTPEWTFSKNDLKRFE